MKTEKYITFIASICLAAASIYYFEGVSSNIDAFNKQQLELGFWIDPQSSRGNSQPQIPSFNGAKSNGQNSDNENYDFNQGTGFVNDVSVSLISNLNSPANGGRANSYTMNSSLPVYKKSGNEFRQDGGVFLDNSSFLLKSRRTNANIPINDINFAGNNLREIAMGNVNAPFKSLGNGTEDDEDPFEPGGAMIMKEDITMFL